MVCSCSSLAAVFGRAAQFIRADPTLPRDSLTADYPPIERS